MLSQLRLNGESFCNTSEKEDGTARYQRGGGCHTTVGCIWKVFLFRKIRKSNLMLKIVKQIPKRTIK